jgi:hypothetical protein
MTARGRNIRVLIREAEESSPSDARENSRRLRLPTLDERVSLYLHAVHGKRDFTTKEYFDARDMILNAMAADIAAKSRGVPLTTSRDDDTEAASVVTLRMAALTNATEVDRRDHQSTAMGVVAHCLRDQVPDSTRDETARARASARRLNRISISVFAAAAAASLALLLFVVLPTIWRPADQNSSGSRLALAPVAPPVAPVAPPVAAVAPETPVESAQKSDSDLGQKPLQTQTRATVEMVWRGLQLLYQGQITEARLLLRRGAERDDATAALLLGTSYDPIELKKLPFVKSNTAGSTTTLASVQTQASPNVVPDSFADIAMARTWYQKAKDLGSIEAARRLESLAGRQPR